jgi:hypothetical protein
MSAMVVKRYAVPRVIAPRHGPALQQRQVKDGSLGDLRSLLAPRSRYGSPAPTSLFAPAKKARRLSGLGGCGCAGIGADAEVAPSLMVEPPFYKTPLFIGGAAVALGVAIYALKRK